MKSTTMPDSVKKNDGAKYQNYLPLIPFADAALVLKESKLDHGKIFVDLLEEYKNERIGSTLTIADLDKEGNLRFSMLGNSPVYLRVKDRTNKEHVIKLSADMQAQVRPFQRDENYDFGVESPKDRYSNYGLRTYNEDYLDKETKRMEYCKGYVRGLKQSGTIGDSDIPNKLAVREFYNFSKGANYTKVLNEYLTTIGVEGDINDLLKKGAAKVVVASNGLEVSFGKLKKIAQNHELIFTGSPLVGKDLTVSRFDPLPEGEIMFKVPDKNGVVEIEPTDNPINYFADLTTPAPKADTVINWAWINLLLVQLEAGKTAVVTHCHEGSEKRSTDINADTDSLWDERKGFVSKGIVEFLKRNYEKCDTQEKSATNTVNLNSAIGKDEIPPLRLNSNENDVTSNERGAQNKDTSTLSPNNSLLGPSKEPARLCSLDNAPETKKALTPSSECLKELTI